MWSIADNIGKFTWKHRGKLTIALVIGIGTAAYMSYMNSTNEICDQSDDHDQSNHDKKSLKKPQFDPKNQLMSSKDKSRLLYQARKQFDIVCHQFLMTLKTKIIDVVDMSTTLRYDRYRSPM